MTERLGVILRDLPTEVVRTLDDFVGAAQRALGQDLQAVVLYGSAAEGQLRTTSDVNVILVLSAFERAKVDSLREPLRVAYAAVRMTAMFLLEEEVEPAAHAFAQKFADVLRRRRILYGKDPFARLAIPREAVVARLKQVLLNLTLRLRALYLTRGLREEQLALVVADAAGPLRTCAASLLELEGHHVGSPKDALRQFVASLGDPEWEAVLSRLSQAREQRRLPPGVAGDVVLRLIELTRRMQARLRARE